MGLMKKASTNGLKKDSNNADLECIYAIELLVTVYDMLSVGLW